MTAPATTSPEGTNPDSESLSNWGSVDENCETLLAKNRARRGEVIQQRRQVGGSGSSNTAARRATASSTTRSEARRASSSNNTTTTSSLRSTKRAAGGGEREGAARPTTKPNGKTPQVLVASKYRTAPAAAPASSKGRRGGSLERPTASSSQERPSAVGGATARRGRKRLSVERNKPRSSSIGSVGKRSSLGSRRGAEDDDREDDLREIEDLDAAAPSQEEIRLMIDRIRRESSAAAADVGVGGRAAAGGKGSRFEHEVRNEKSLLPSSSAVQQVDGMVEGWKDACR